LLNFSLKPPTSINPDPAVAALPPSGEPAAKSLARIDLVSHRRAGYANRWAEIIDVNFMEISYRKLVSEDAQRYREIRLESLKAHPESFGATFEEQNQLPQLMFEKALMRPWDERFVLGAFHQAELVGICGFVPFNDLDLSQTGTVIQMYIKANYRGRKIGLNLVQGLLQIAFSIPEIEKVVLGVNIANLGAMRVYEQAGFQIYQTGKSDDEFQIMLIRRG
jgi:RimJ/RimL family protein N-acetyltransferase